MIEMARLERAMIRGLLSIAEAVRARAVHGEWCPAADTDLPCTCGLLDLLVVRGYVRLHVLADGSVVREH